MKKSLIILTISLLIGIIRLQAQEYTGISGLIHVPSAEMNPTGTARIGTFFLNKEFLPDVMQYTQDGVQHKFHSFNHFLSIDPFSWIELAYTCTLLKGIKDGKPKYFMKDRYLSVKIRILKERKYIPAIAIGTNDPYHIVSNDLPSYYQNFYAAATKHFDLHGHELGVHLAYRWYKETTNKKWQGIVGGITYRPAFEKNLRGIVEYTGNDINIGVDYYLWKLLFVQANLQNGKYFSGGIMLQIQL